MVPLASKDDHCSWLEDDELLIRHEDLENVFLGAKQVVRGSASGLV